MADQKDTAPVFLKCTFQRILCIYIKVVGRLIQKQNICVSVYKLAQTYLRLLTTTLDTYLALDMFGSQSAFRKG